MKRFLLALFAAALVCGFAACSDDDTPSIDRAQLIGTWQQTDLYDGELDQWDDGNSRLVFREDGTGEDFWWSYSGESGSDPFTYTLHGNRLKINYDGDISEGRIVKLTSEELVLAGDYRGEDGKKYTNKVFYERLD